MVSSLKNTCFNIWKNNTDRKGIRTEFSPVFARFIGIENVAEYNNILKTFVDKFKENPQLSVYFDGEIPMEADFKLINAVKSELPNMDISRLSSEDITIFKDAGFNSVFLHALEYSVNLAMKNESFSNESQKHNFIMKMILWAYQNLSNINIGINKTAKCMYYGNISRHEIYFLIMLSKMGFDVIYINPLKEENWNETDTDGLSEKKNASHIQPVETLHSRIQNASSIIQNESVALQFERQMDEELFSGTGVFRPWQFRDGNTKALFISSSIVDVENNWNEPARVRAGFEVHDRTVTVPCYFHVIDGEYRDKNEYSRLCHLLTTSENTLTLINGSGISFASLDDDKKFQIQFCYLSDGSLDAQKVKELDFYQYGRYKPEVQDFIIGKINELIMDETIFSSPLSKSGKIDLIAMLLCMDEKIIRLIDAFDYTENVPKIVVFIEKENSVDEKVLKMIAFMCKVGADIVILNPSGLFSPDTVLNRDRYNNRRLESINYERTFDSASKKTKTSFFGKLFG